jgi:hypothetical protein
VESPVADFCRTRCKEFKAFKATTTITTTPATTTQALVLALLPPRISREQSPPNCAPSLRIPTYAPNRTNSANDLGPRLSSLLHYASLVHLNRLGHGVPRLLQRVLDAFIFAPLPATELVKFSISQSPNLLHLTPHHIYSIRLPINLKS